MKMTRILGCIAGLALLGIASPALWAQTSVETVSTNLSEPFAVASLPDGTIYISDGANNRIMKLGAGTTVGSILAGQAGVTGTNDGVGTAAQFFQPQGLVVARGGLVVADSGNHTLRFITFSGVVTTLAGAPGAFGSANGPAASARFRFPAGLAADSAGNIFIADSQNNSIRKLDTNNNVTTVITGLYQPAGVAVGGHGELWVTDTRRHCIKVLDTNGVLTTVAGISGVSGMDDAPVATNATFTMPRALLWLSDMSGVLVSDSGNHTIRRIYYNPNFSALSVETYAGVPGTYGLLNGPALSARFNTPLGIARDELSGGFLVVDKANNQLRRINTGTVQAPVADPVIGWVDLVKDGFGAYVTHINPVISSVFNNDVIIAIRGELGTSSYYTYGTTPASPLEDTIPAPAPGVGLNPPAYRDGEPPSGLPPTMLQPQPDMTIKAIGTQDGRRSSQLVQARFQFKVGNPVVNGDNAASFTIEDITDNSQLWYTWDGSEPTNSLLANPAVIGPMAPGTQLSFNIGDSNRTFKIKAYKGNYKPSDTLTKVFSPSNFVANSISFGFEGGEASCAFVAAPGQHFYVPVTLSLLPAQKIYSFQFNIISTNRVGLPIDISKVGFDSMLTKPVKINGVEYMAAIPPAMAAFDGGPLVSLIETNPAINLLSIGWIERMEYTNLYNTLAQDLVTYSMAHDRLFNSMDGKVVMGAYSFHVPLGSPANSQYRLALSRPSATSDGISEDVYIRVPTNGSLSVGAMNGVKDVAMGIRQYVVGDVAPFRWFNAGDFGDTNLLNNDVLQVFQSAVYFINQPPHDSDMYDAMDTSNGLTNNYAYDDGASYDIDQVKFGDGMLAIDDVYVAYRRSLDPTLKWYARYWSNNVRQVVEVPNTYPGGGKSLSPIAKSSVTGTGTPSVSIAPDDGVGAPGTAVEVPIRVHVSGARALKMAMLNVVVEPLDGSPPITNSISLGGSPLGTPTYSSSQTPNQIAVAWMGTTPAVTGDTVLATLTIQIPPDAGANAAYRIRIDHFSASPNGISLMRSATLAGVVTTTSRTGSSWSDAISDLWRLRWFGSATSPLSSPAADPDGDGRDNLSEYLAGTNPLDRASRLTLLPRTSAGGGVTLTFPTGLGRTYYLECAPALNGPWSPLSTNIGTGDFREWSDSATGNGTRFYRVRAQ